MRRGLLEFSAWFLFAAVLTAPGWWGGRLIGNPNVDVWNHAWGLWWWWESLRHGVLPWHTTLLAAPGGGTLWFADPVGAATMLPITALFGPAAAWNLLLVGRVAWSGFHARRLAGVLGTRGPHTVVAGVIFATTPYLLAELQNGISEVCATGWVPLVIAEAVVAGRVDARRGDWIRLGLAFGGAWVATPYYGVALGLLLAPAGLGWLVSGGRPGRSAALAVLVAGSAAVGTVGLWRGALSAPDAVIQRDTASAASLARHNAVDVREPFLPGTFRSVDFDAEYGGEQFVHTTYLRWSVLILVGTSLWRRPRRWGAWLGLAGWGLVLAMGERVFYGGAYPFGATGGVLPFGLLLRLVSDLAITHPARFVVTTHAVLAAVAADALCDTGRRAWLWAPVVAAEALFASTIRWPLPISEAVIPSIYGEIALSPDRRGVLDLPSQVRRTMATSRYFWFQTAHHHPVPWWPNVRTEDNADPETMRLFVAAPGGRATMASLGPEAVTRLRERYGWVVVHPELDRMTRGAGESTRILTEAFGAPEGGEGTLSWRLDGLEGSGRSHSY